MTAAAKTAGGSWLDWRDAWRAMGRTEAGIAPRDAVGKTLTYAAAAYRVAQSKRHPASAVRTLVLAEK